MNNRPFEYIPKNPQPGNDPRLARICTTLSHLRALEGDDPSPSADRWVQSLYDFLGRVRVGIDGDAVTVEFDREPSRREAEAAGLAARAAAALEADDAPRAARLYNRALELQPYLASAWFGLGQAFGACGAPGMARAGLLVAARLCPDHVDCLAKLADMATDAQDPATAERLARLVLRLDPNHHLACNVLCWALLATERAREAVAELRRAMRARREDPAPAFGLAVLLLTIGRPRAALKLVRCVEDIESRSPSPVVGAENIAGLRSKIQAALAQHS